MVDFEQVHVCKNHSITLHRKLIDCILRCVKYLLRVNNRNIRTKCEICSKLTLKTQERRRRRSGVFIVNFEHISHLVIVFLLLTLNM